MNLLVDFDPAAFFRDTIPAAADSENRPAGSNLLLTQLDKHGPHLLSLFIASLRNDSVRDCLYHFAPSPPHSSPTTDWAALAASTGKAVEGKGARGVEEEVGKTTKVNAVCDLLTEAIRARADPKLRACMVLTFVRRHPPRVEEALMHLQGTEEDEASHGLEVLMGLVEPSNVWDTALGLYDLGLTALVARISGRDPREYVPLLEKLSQMPDRECCFEIDMMLKRYGKAVMHAVKGGDNMWEKAREVMEQNGLYTVAIQNLRRFPERRAHLEEALRLYAAYLGERGEHKLAGLVYKTAGLNFEATGELQQDAGSWEAAMLLLHEQANLTEPQLQRRSYDMAEALRLAGDSRGAARLYLDYCADVDEGVAALSEGREWVEAARVARCGKRQDLIPTTVLPSLLEAHTATLQDVDARLERLEYIAQRLVAIEVDKQAQLAAERRYADGEGGDGHDVDDAASDWSRSQAPSASSKGTHSTHSSHSSRSSRSSKSNKTRSSARVPKEGDPWEEDYLNKTRPPLVPTRGFREALRSLLEALVMFAESSHAATLQLRFAKLEDYVLQHELGGLAVEPPPPTASDWKITFLDAPV